MWTGSHLLSESAQHMCLEETLVTYLSVSVLKKWLRTPTRPHTEALGNELHGCSRKLFLSDPRAFRGIREECQAAGCWWHWLRQPVVPLAPAQYVTTNLQGLVCVRIPGNEFKL